VWPVTPPRPSSDIRGAASSESVSWRLDILRCYHPLFLFNDDGDCLAAKLRSGNVHSADDWDELLVPEIELSF
jgi:hypothetical protein